MRRQMMMISLVFAFTLSLLGCLLWTPIEGNPPSPHYKTSPSTILTASATPTPIATSDLPFPPTLVWPPDGGYVDGSFAGGIWAYPTHFPAMAAGADYVHESGIRYQYCRGFIDWCDPLTVTPLPEIFPEGDYTWSVWGQRSIAYARSDVWHFTVQYDVTVTATPSE